MKIEEEIISRIALKIISEQLGIKIKEMRYDSKKKELILKLK